MTSRLELRLEPVDDGCELEFVQHAVDRERFGEIGPGWEHYLDKLVASRDDGPAPRFDSYYPAQEAYFLGLASESPPART